VAIDYEDVQYEDSVSSDTCENDGFLWWGPALPGPAPVGKSYVKANENPKVSYQVTAVWKDAWDNVEVHPTLATALRFVSEALSVEDIVKVTIEPLVS
jgi:hypothetical protein